MPIAETSKYWVSGKKKNMIAAATPNTIVPSYPVSLSSRKLKAHPKEPSPAFTCYNKTRCDSEYGSTSKEEQTNTHPPTSLVKEKQIGHNYLKKSFTGGAKERTNDTRC